MLLPIIKNILWLLGNIIDLIYLILDSEKSIFCFFFSPFSPISHWHSDWLPQSLIVSWNIINLISVVDFFLSRLNSFWQRWDITSHPTARSLFQFKDSCCCCWGNPHEKRFLLNTLALLIYFVFVRLFSSSGSLFLSLVNSWRSQGINQTQCSSGWVLGFAPDWVMMVDIEPSGSLCSGLVVAAGVWLRLLEKHGC